MGGYADLSQTDTGLHMRMRSRAFIVADAVDTTSRILFINSGMTNLLLSCPVPYVLYM
jgi:neutral ceramidase